MDNSAMVVRNANARNGGADHQLSTHSSGVINESGQSKVSKARNKDPMVCTYCKKPHTREKCWKLHGKPSNFQIPKQSEQTTKNGPTKGQRQSHVTRMQPGEETTSFLDQAQFNREEIEKLNIFGNFRNFRKPASFGTCSLAFSSNRSQSFPLNVLNMPTSGSWIIDFGATNHITTSSHHFVSYSPCPINKKISTVDGTLIIVVGQGDVVINLKFVLNNVLHVPKLSINLVSFIS